MTLNQPVVIQLMLQELTNFSFADYHDKSECIPGNDNTDLPTLAIKVVLLENNVSTHMNCETCDLKSMDYLRLITN